MISYLSGRTYGFEITPSTYNLTCWGRIYGRLLYPNTYVHKRGQVINTMLLTSYIQGGPKSKPLPNDQIHRIKSYQNL